MTMTLGELADLGEPKRHETYTRSLPHRPGDVCNTRAEGSRESYVEAICQRWLDHEGDHADISPSGFVLATWENEPPDPWWALDDDEADASCEECRDAHERDGLKVNHRIHRLPRKVRDAYERLNEISDLVGETIADAMGQMRDLRKEIEQLTDNEGLVEEFDYSQTALLRLESDAKDLGVPEEDWT